MLGLIVALALVGLVLYLIETQIPIDPTIKVVIRIVVILFVVLWLIRLLGIGDLPLPKVGSR